MKYILTLLITLFAKLAMGQLTPEQDVLNLSALKFRYMTESKIDSLAELFDAKMILQHANGRTQSKTEYIENLTSGLLKYNSTSVKEPKAVVIGMTAMVFGECVFNITFNGQPMQFNMSYTEVYAWQNGKWKMALYSVRNLDTK